MFATFFTSFFFLPVEPALLSAPFSRLFVLGAILEEDFVLGENAALQEAR
jgi:hypothetical protein